MGGGAQQQCSASASCPQTQVAASPAAHPGGQLEQPWDPFTFPGPTKVFEVQAGTSSSHPAGATVGRWLRGASQLHCRCWLAQARGRVLVILSSAGPWVSTSTRGPESRLSGCVGGGLQRAGACVGSCLKHAPHSSPRSWEGGGHRLAAARGPADRGRWCSPVWRSVHETVGATTAVGCAQRPVPPCGPGPVPWGLGGLAGSPWTPGHARRRRHSILT